MSKRKYKDGIITLPSGRYMIRPRDQFGDRINKTFDRWKDAKAALDEIRAAVRSKEYVQPAKIPTVEEAATVWLEGKKISESKNGTPSPTSRIGGDQSS